MNRRTDEQMNRETEKPRNRESVVSVGWTEGSSLIRELLVFSDQQIKIEVKVEAET
jgi:hypothetical protein